jgi:hypothetical protein
MAEDKRNSQSKLLTVIISLCMFFGLIGFMIFLSEEIGLDETIIIPWFFGLLGGMAYVALLRTKKAVWRALSAGLWIMTLIGFTIYLTEEVNIHEGLAMSIFFPALGLLLYLMFSQQSPIYVGSHSQPAPPTQLNAQNQFDPLGQPTYEDMTPIERDRAASRR